MLQIGGYLSQCYIFSSPGRSPGRAIVLPSASALAAEAVSALAKSLMLKFFYVLGKALSGELSCPCDRSCFYMYWYTISCKCLKNKVHLKLPISQSKFFWAQKIFFVISVVCDILELKCKENWEIHANIFLWYKREV